MKMVNPHLNNQGLTVYVYMVQIAFGYSHVNILCLAKVSSTLIVTSSGGVDSPADVITSRCDTTFARHT